MRRTVATLLLFFGMVLPLCSYAATPLVFDNRITGATKLNLSHFTRAHLQSDIEKYDIARIDLNDDYYDEYILKQKNCVLDVPPEQFCTFIIIGEKEEKLVQISVFNAKKIQISGKKHAGIYDILAFQSKKNDYEYERYIWSPDDKTYIREGTFGG
ncbi:MAG: hypothetical protein OEY94_00975 [Alphaproteobacteria bacterium]|nr:hypothetical protein [Alphaproteobacteria bacterium]